MVIDQGRELYFGPANKAVEYFASIGIYKPPRQTTSDFLTGVTQLHERTVLPGWEDKAPKTAEDFERSWLESQEYRTLKGDIQRFEQRIETDNRSAEIRDFVDQTKMGTEKSKLRRKSPYTTTFTYQLGKLFKREWEIMMGSIGQQIFKIAYNAAFAIIVGTLFLSLPETTMGAFTRGGVLFFALLFNSLSAQAELPKAITGREVVYKHKSFAMYHPAALSLAQTVVDIPIMVLQIVIFSCILYFATGLSRTAGQFFAFVLFLFIGCLCLTAFFRLIGNVSPNVDVAHTLSGISLLFMILHIGYLIPQKSMHGYLVWIYWANSLAYAYKALMANEFRNLKLKCGGPQLFPQIPGVGIDNQVCTLQGAVPGQDYVLGRDHIEVGYSFIVDDMWKDFGAVVGFWLLYVILIAVVMEYVEFGNTGYSINVYKRRRPKVNLYTEKDGESNHGVDTFGKVASSGPTDEQILAGTAFTWKNVNYAVPVKGGNKQLLDDVSGYIKPGTMTALMGSSGAGKTTLLDSLSQRKTIGTLDGEILMNGAPQPASFRRITGYCEQLDVHNPHSTVREALRFSAYLRQSASVSDEEKNDYVEHVIYLLGMTDIADCMIGLPESGEGISLEERKRLTIGVELVAKPKILFLDEPTSGLDAQASFTIVTFLRRLAAEGQTILCTIHQPSSMLFEQFDRLLLLVRGGHTVYFGDIGHDAQTLINYFERNGGPKCPPSANPAEYILDVVGSRNATVDWPQTWSDSKEKTTILGEIDRINELEHLHGNDQVSEDDKNMFARDYWYQIKLVTKRMFRSYWRDLEYSLTRVALQVVSAIVIGIAFLRLSTSATDLQNKVFALFQTAIISILIINQVQPQFLRQRLYYGREASSNQYGWRAFSAAIIVTEWPFSIFANTIYFVIMYWLVGLNTGSD
ncbi:ATP-binding cassette transporter snq2, partial [Linderina macrospora]